VRKIRLVTVAGLLLIAASASTAFAGSIIDEDPLFFCNTSQGFNPGGCGGDPNIITSTTSFGMFNNGQKGGSSSDPWYLLVAIPDYAGSAPAITSDGSVFTQVGTTSSATFLASTQGSIYDLFGLVGDASMNASNMFGIAEQAVLGSTPTSFKVFEYTFTPSFNTNTAYSFTVGGTGLTAGTFLAGSGGSNPFSTPFTVAGLIHGTPDTGSTLVLLGGALLGLAVLCRRLPA
jgi:hypothetical protein